MRKAVLILGVLATFLTGMWGLFASAFGSFPGAQFPRLLAFLMMAPLSILPAGALAGSRPRAAGIGLIVAAVASGVSLLYVTYDFEGYPIRWRESALALVGTCLPLTLLGAGLLASAAMTKTATSGPTSRLGTIYACAHLAATVLIVIWAIVATAQWASKLQWALTVTPTGGAPHTVWLDARVHQTKLQSRISEALDPVFTDPGRPGPLSLGRFELAGRDGGGKEIRMGYESRLEAKPGRVTVTRSDLPKGMNYIDADSFWNAKLMIVQHLEQFVAINKLSSLR